MIAGWVVGAFFAFGGWLILPRHRDEELHVRGTVARVWDGHSLGSPAWKYTITFADDTGALWTFEPSLTRGRRQQVGAPVPVAYRTSNPAGTARRTDGLDGYLGWVLVATGAATAVAATLLS